MVDLNILKQDKKRDTGVSETEAVVDFLREDNFEEYESKLMQFNRICALQKVEIDPAVKELVGEEGIIAKTTHGLATAIKSIGITMNNFSKWLYNTIRDRVVTEKYIHNKFMKLDAAIKSIQETRAYVAKVPTYDILEKRLVSILQVVDYISELSKKEKLDESVDAIIQKVVLKSGGLLKIGAANADSPYTNIQWNEAPLTEYDIKSSKWANSKESEKLKNLMLKAKYETVDDLAKASSLIAKKCSAVDNQVAETGYGETSEVDYNTLADSYNVSYVVGKLIKQVYSQGIQKEINTIAICYLYRLTKYEIK